MKMKIAKNKENNELENKNKQKTKMTK